MLLPVDLLFCCVKDVWGVPNETGHKRGPHPVRTTVKTMVDMAQQGTYHTFLSDRQKRSSHHPRGQYQLCVGSGVACRQAWNAAYLMLLMLRNAMDTKPNQ